MFTNIFMTDYKVGKLDTSSILLCTAFFIGSFACFNQVEIFKCTLFSVIVFYDTVVKFNYLNTKQVKERKERRPSAWSSHAFLAQRPSDVYATSRLASTSVNADNSRTVPRGHWEGSRG